MGRACQGRDTPSLRHASLGVRCRSGEIRFETHRRFRSSVFPPSGGHAIVAGPHVPRERIEAPATWGFELLGWLTASRPPSWPGMENMVIPGWPPVGIFPRPPTTVASCGHRRRQGVSQCGSPEGHVRSPRMKASRCHWDAPTKSLSPGRIDPRNMGWVLVALVPAGPAGGGVRLKRVRPPAVPGAARSGVKHRNPQAKSLGGSGTGCPAVTYSPTPSRVQYHRRSGS